MIVTDSATPSEQFAEITAFLDTLSDVDPDAPTFCAGWTAHDLLAHLVAGGEEMRRLVAAKLAGRPVPATRPFAEREAPFVALPDDELRDLMGRPGLLRALDELYGCDPSATVAFTGAELTATQLMTHVRSELTLHRWDLIGDDDVGRALLAQPDLLAHGRFVLGQMLSLAEARNRPADDHGDLLVLWGRRR
jgi:uncharacterized protein (TIGR03083 family)